LHVRPRTSSAGTYHHPFVSYFGMCSGYHACGTSRTSFHYTSRSVLRRLCSAVIPNSLWHRFSRASVFHPWMWTLNLRCSPSGQPSILVGTKSTSVTSSIHCSPRAWRLRHFAPGNWRCSAAWHLWKRFLTPRTLCPTFHVIADSAQAVLTSRAKVSEFDEMAIAPCVVYTRPAFDLGGKFNLGFTGSCPCRVGWGPPFTHPWPHNVHYFPRYIDVLLPIFEPFDERCAYYLSPAHQLHPTSCIGFLVSNGFR
jgi:hypothetical protein